MKKILAGAAIAALSLTFAGCSSPDAPEAKPAKKASPARQEQVLNLYNWSEYMPQEVLDQFREETGIRVVYTTYDSNEAMYARLRLLDSSSQYDLAVPSTYYVDKMRREGLLAEIDHSKLSGLENLDTSLMNQDIDPDNRYSVPYLWGSTGIAVNADAIDPDGITAWADLWRPQFQGRLMLMNDVREVFHVGLRVLGYSANSTDPAEIEAAYNKLAELIPGVRTFNSDAPRMPYLEGETDIGMIWNGEAVMGAEDMPSLTYIYPKEGVALWMDSFVIPKNSRNVEAAHKFIDFMLRPEISALISTEIGYATPNIAARELLDEEVLSDRTIYPESEDLLNAEFQEDVGEALLVYQRFWELLKAGR